MNVLLYSQHYIMKCLKATSCITQNIWWTLSLRLIIEMMKFP